MKNIWYNPKLHNYYDSIEKECVKCQNLCIPLRIDILKYNKAKNLEILCICSSCWPDYKVNQNYEIHRVVLLEEPPEGSILIIDAPPVLRAGGTSDWAAVHTIKGYKGHEPVIVDHTKLAGKDSLEDAQIGKDVSVELEQLDKHLVDESEAFGLLGEHKNAKPVMPQQLENKGDDVILDEVEE